MAIRRALRMFAVSREDTKTAVMELDATRRHDGRATWPELRGAREVDVRRR